MSQMEMSETGAWWAARFITMTTSALTPLVSMASIRTPERTILGTARSGEIASMTSILRVTRLTMGVQGECWLTEHARDTERRLPPYLVIQRLHRRLQPGE